MRRFRIYLGKLELGFRTFTLQIYLKTKSSYVSYNREFIRTPLFTRVQIRSVSKCVQLCCEITRVNAFTPRHQRIGTYLGKYLSNFFSVLIFLRIDHNQMLFLRIASKPTKLIRSNILVCEIPRSFERLSPSNFRTQGSFIHINSGKISNATFFRQIALQNLQRKNLGFSGTDLYVFAIYQGKGPIKIIKRVKIAHSFLQSVSDQFHAAILSLPV